MGCTGLSRDCAMTNFKGEMVRLTCMGRICPHDACTKCHYISVVVLVMYSTARHIVASNDTTSDMSGRINGQMHLRSDVTDNMFILDDIGHVHFFIVRFGTRGL